MLGLVLAVQIVLVVVGFALVVWGAVRAYRKAPTMREEEDGIFSISMGEKGDAVGLWLALAGAIVALAGGLLGLFAQP